MVQLQNKIPTEGKGDNEIDSPERIQAERRRRKEAFEERRRSKRASEGSPGNMRSPLRHFR